MLSTINSSTWTGLSASSACLEKPSCLHILICTDAFVHHCCANLISRGSRTRHQTKAFKLKKNWSFNISRPGLNLSWLLNGNRAQTIGCQQQDMAYSSADLRKWLSVNNSPLLGRNMAGTMEECEFPCFSIKPSAYQEENNTSKEWWRPGLIDLRSHTDIRSCVCAGVEPFMRWCCCTSLKSQFHIWVIL